MVEFPLSFQPIHSTTWAYVSSLLLLALFFKFNRFWSVRNLDLLLIVLLAPGLLMVHGGQQWVIDHCDRNANDTSLTAIEDSNSLVSPQVNDQEDSLNQPTEPPSSAFPADSSVDSDQDLVSPGSDQPAAGEALQQETDTIGHGWQRFGYIWLFSVGLLLLVRLLLDPILTRRPVLEPNLSQGGLFFAAICLMAFLTINVIVSKATDEDVHGAKDAIRLLQREASQPGDKQLLSRRGPGYTIFYVLPILPMFENGDAILETDVEEQNNGARFVLATKILAITSQFLIVLGLILFCYYNFDNLGVGVGTAAIYLMLPYTSIYTGYVMHTLPAALLLWAIVSFRRPLLSGILVGLAAGVSYYPIFLLPLWASFYWERGVRRFVLGFLISISLGICGLIFTSVDSADFLTQLQAMFGFWRPKMTGLEGIWALGWSRWWRVPILVAFVVYCISFVAWPSEKNLGTLVAYTASIMVGVQFWHGFGGGVYMAWYLPLLLLIVFRPNLAGRVASSELREIQKSKPESAKDILPAD